MSTFDRIAELEQEGFLTTEQHDERTGKSVAELTAIVRESRQRTAEYFPLPSAKDCILYAITEIGEYLDALLRLDRPDDKRNNNKQLSPMQEWGQAGYMIASAIIQRTRPAYSLAIGGTVFDVLRELTYGPQKLDAALESWALFCSTCDWDAEQLLRDTCAAFERKHLPREGNA
jgi:hypothetical protein